MKDPVSVSEMSYLIPTGYPRINVGTRNVIMNTIKGSWELTFVARLRDYILEFSKQNIPSLYNCAHKWNSCTQSVL